MRKLLFAVVLAVLIAPVMAERFYVRTRNPVVGAFVPPVHRFPGAFSAELTSGQAKVLERMGVKVEAVGLFHVTAPPNKCGDGTCQGFESPDTCPDDCSDGGGDDGGTDRTCYPDSQMPWGVARVGGGSGGSGVTVAVLDTGVDTDHPDLSVGACVSKVTHFPPDSRDCEDKHGHGTHVAGTIAANGGSDGLGIYGVAPAADLLVVKVCDRKGSCYGDDMAAGIRYAADHGADVVSMSIGGDSPDSQVLSAIDYAVGKGVLVVAAAGNDGPADGSIDYPGAYVKTVAVGATDSSDAVPSWSSRGVNDGDWTVEEREVEFGAPGVSVESTYNDGCYAYMSGTSMATPHVSGLAASLWQGDAATTRSYLQDNAEDIWTTGDDTATGFGLP